MAIKISIGPIQYFWRKEQVFRFYDEIKKSPVDIVYLGETVCAKRRQLSFDDWLSLAEQLTDAGKEVVLSTLSLFEAESELSTLRRIAANSKFTVEANDMAAVRLLARNGSFIIGPHINCYNSQTLQFLNTVGAKRWVVPVEIGRETIRQILQLHSSNMETELFAYGHLPLAFSARCYTARAHNRPKDECDFICLDFQDGLPLYTQKNEPFLIINGTQTQSAATHISMNKLSELEETGIDVIRIMPQSQGTEEIISIFHAVLNSDLHPQTATQQLEPYQLFESCNGYWHGQEGMAYVE